VRDGTVFGEHLAGALPRPDFVLCSTARRTRDTLAFLVPDLVDPRRVQFEDGLYEASAAGLLERLRTVPAAAGTVLLIGHNPGLTDLVNLLADDGPGVLDNLPTFACARFALATPFAALAPRGARLVALLRPKDHHPGDP
jgi:phosphohistidine phosphatase